MNLGELAIRFGYGILIVGVIFCFLYSQKSKREIRQIVNSFAFAFVKISNLVSPDPPRTRLAVRKGKPLPREEQPEAIQVIMRRANSDKAVALYGELQDAMSRLEKRCRGNASHRVQFLEPLQALYVMTHIFLTGCENPATLDTKDRQDQFGRYLRDQLDHRMVLLKRITGDAGPEYLELNKHYDLKGREAEEAEHRKRGKQTAQKTEPSRPSPEGELSPQPEPAPEPEETASEESVREQWRGWGCG